MRIFTQSLALSAIALPVPAFAHIGHLGEVAGHGHWVGVAAIAGAAALGALAAKLNKKRDAEQAQEEEPEVASEGEAA